MSLLILWFACGGKPTAPIPAMLIDDVPSYPGLRLLCDEVIPASNGDMSVTAYASRDDLATVRAFYEKNHGAKAFPQPSGPRLLLRVRKDVMVVISPPDVMEYTCGVAPHEGETAVVVSNFRRTIGEGITTELNERKLQPTSPGGKAEVVDP